MDAKDRQIAMILQRNARTSNAEIARQLGMAPSAVFERIRKLEARGVIEGYEARLSASALGLDLVAFVFVRTRESVGKLETGRRLAELPEVQEVHQIAGEDCYLVKVRAAGTNDLGRLMREKFGAIPSVRSTRTTIVLTTLKESALLPVGLEPGEVLAASEDDPSDGVTASDAAFEPGNAAPGGPFESSSSTTDDAFGRDAGPKETLAEHCASQASARLSTAVPREDAKPGNAAAEREAGRPRR